MEVTSACNSPGIVGGQQTAKRKFFQWAVKWFYANMAEDTLEKPDAPVLICLLQSVGFQLREFEKIEESNERNKETRPRKDTVRLFLECGTSGMRACLELKDVKCKCPNPEDAKDASFWSVSGTGPNAAAKIENVNRIEESGSNLLPKVPKETGKILHDVTYHLLNIIADKTSDINQNSNNLSNLNISSILNASNDKDDSSDRGQAEKLKMLSASIGRSYTQPEIHLPAKARRGNWTVRRFDKLSDAGANTGDVEKWSTDLENEIIENDQPRPSPPKISSSPVFMTQLSSSLGQISLQSEEEASSNVVEHVVQARKNLDKALEILMAKKSPNSRNSSCHEQATFLKPAPGGLNLTGGALRRLSTSSSNTSLRSPSGTVVRSRPSSACSLPSREATAASLTQQASRTTSLAHQSAGTPKSSSSTYTRRTIGAASLSASTTTIQSSNVATGAVKRQISNVEQNPGTKIPGRRKSFSVLSGQPLRLAATAAKNTAIAAKQKKSPDPKGSNTSLSQSSLAHRSLSSSINQPAPANLKFGYVKKKSSYV